MKQLKELLEEARQAGQPVGYTGDREDWLVAYSITRDSDLLTRANWEALTARLKDVPGWAVERFDHWAVGWLDYLLVKPGSPAQKVAEEALEALESYPILDEEVLARLEAEEAREVWGVLTEAERREMLEKVGLDPALAEEEEMPGDSDLIAELTRA